VEGFGSRIRRKAYELASIAATNVAAALVWAIGTPGAFYWPAVLHVISVLGIVFLLRREANVDTPGKVRQAMKPGRRRKVGTTQDSCDER
jgi:hypothetical protein